MACEMSGKTFNFSPVQEASKHSFISVDDISVVLVGSTINLPENRGHWPVSFLKVDLIENCEVWTQSSKRPYVLCGLKNDVLRAMSKLDNSGKTYPIYIISDEPISSSVCEGFCVSSLGKEWEEVISTICSLHVSTIPQMIVRQAKQTPETVALISPTAPTTLTYAQLVLHAWELGGCILSAISEHQTSPLPDNPLVGFILAPSSLSVVTLLALGLRRIGAVVIASKPSQVTEYQLRKVGCHALLVENPITTSAVSCVIRVSELYDKLLEKGFRSDVSSVVTPQGVDVLNDVCLVEWTSGSTGKPKAMAVTAWRLAHWIRWRQYHFPMDTYGHTVGVGLFWAWYWHIPLCQGGTMVVIPDEMTVDVVAMVDYLGHHRVDWVDCLTPGQLKMMAELVSAEAYPQLPIKHVMSSGEALSIPVAKAFLSRFPSTTLSNVLSTTETAADICCLKNVTLQLCERLANHDSIKHVPVLKEGESVVWGNVLAKREEDGERLLIRGWNIQPGGYATGEHKDSFINRDSSDNGGSINECGCFLTGDRIVWKEIDGGRYGCVEGRVDDVVKIRGFRVDLAGVEACLNSCTHVRDAAALSHEDTLYALVVLTAADVGLDVISEFLKDHLPSSSVPSLIVVPEIEYAKTGKKARKSMVKFLPHSNDSADLSGLDLWSQKAILLVMQQQLGVSMKPTDSFFDLGGNSFKALRVCRDCQIPVALFFAHPSPLQLCLALASSTSDHSINDQKQSSETYRKSSSVEVCGMGIRLPGANTVNELWEKLKKGEVMTTVVSDEKGHVNQKGVADCNTHCGSAFGAFGDCTVSPLVLNGMSIAGPTSLEQRVLLELSFEALQDAGFDPLEMSKIRTGVFVCGGSLPHLGDLDEMRRSDPAKYFALEIGHDKDYLAASVAWALDLRGPCEVVATACSSSLVAISRAVHAIRLGLCDVALAGGASFSSDEAMAYEEGMIWSKDGCKPFCDNAEGTVPADGAAVVCLVSEAFYESVQKRKLNHYSTVEGVAVNNDGRRKGGFCQPSMAGQVEVVKAALVDARVGPNEVDYAEAHGTGTRIGDPIEIEALSQVYRGRTNPCKLLVGSLKGNIGHLNTVAGVASFVKTSLSLKHGLVIPLASHSSVPPLLNTLVDWPSLPLSVATSSAIESHVQSGGSMQCATVSAFGIGGTNACVLMSKKHGSDQSTGFIERPVLQLVESFCPEAVVRTLDRCVSQSKGCGDDLAFEFELMERIKSQRSKEGFRSFQVVSRDKQPVAQSVKSMATVAKKSVTRPVVLVFPGQGGAYQHMGEALVSSGLLECSPFNHESNWMSSESILQVSLSIADAVTRSLPKNSVVACVGHSFGEWVAAAYCGVVCKEDALEIARLRDKLVANITVDSSRTPLMLSIRASSATLSALGLPSNMSVCIVNGPMNVVVGGHYCRQEEAPSSDYDIKNVEVLNFLSKLDEGSISWRVLNTTTAFHTPAVASLRDPLLEAVSALGQLQVPSIPIISSVSGTYVETSSSADFTDAKYWSTQCMIPVRFDLSLSKILSDFPEAVIVEVGPSALVGIIKQQGFDVWPTLKSPSGQNITDSDIYSHECRTFLACLGNLFVHCNALPSIPTSRGSMASFPPYDFTLHQPRAASLQVSQTTKQTTLPCVGENGASIYDVTWEKVAGGISNSRVPVLPVLILEHMIKPTRERREKAVAYLEQINLESCAEDYFVVDGYNLVTAAQRHGRLAIVAGGMSELTELDGEEVIALCRSMIDVVQRLSSSASDTPLDMFLLFDSSARYSGLRGLMRSCRSECSHFRIRSVTLQSTAWYLGGGKWSRPSEAVTEAILPALPSELFVSSSQHCYQPRIKTSVNVAKHVPPLEGVLALVTGGLSGVGLSVAKYLLTSGTASQVILVGRTKRDSVLLDEVIELGGIVVQCDVSNTAQMKGLQDSLSDRGEVGLVVHCAGVIADELLIKVSPEHCQEVLAPKVLGTLLLYSCFPSARFILFSSSSSPLGVVGQSTYGAANAFMDEMAAQWSHNTNSVQWGGWGEAGMAIAHHITPLAGERYFTTEEGLCVLDKVLSTSTSPVCMPLSVDWPLYATNPSIAAAKGSVLFQSVLSESAVNITSAGERSLIGSSVVAYERVFGCGDAYMGERPDMAHVVDEEAILPATSYLSWALECIAMEHSLTHKRGNGSTIHRYRLRSCKFVKPLSLSEMRVCQLVMTEIDEVGGKAAISCGGDLHASVKFEWPTSVTQSSISLDGDDARGASSWREVTEPYDVFSKQGFQYGPSFSRLRQVKVRIGVVPSKSEARACVNNESSLPSAGTLDSSLQLISLCDGGVMGVPTKIETFECFAPLDITTSTSNKTNTVQVKPCLGGFDLLMLDGVNGTPVVKMSSIELFPLFQSHSAFTFKLCPQPQIDNKLFPVTKSLHHIKLDHSKDGISAEIQVADCTVKQLVALIEDIRKCARGNAIRSVTILPTVASDTLSMNTDQIITCCLAMSVIVHCVQDLGLKVASTLHELSENNEMLSVPGPSESVCSNNERFKACCDPDGIDGVWFERSALKELSSHEVEIQTSCWALNFRDVLVSRGAIPMDTSGERLGIGGECGGIVVRVGSKVTCVSVGDEVVAVPPDGMGSFVVVREEFVSPPLPWKQEMEDIHSLSAVASNIASKHSTKSLHPTFEQAQCERVVSQTLVYATAWLALEWQARVRTGDVVLVHSGAGGVGLAAICLLQRKQCVIYATASTVKKRNILKSIGCQEVFDSRNVEGFTTGIQAAEVLRTGNSHKAECVDVVLNSLTGDAVSASLSLLRAFGRFVELGKRSSFEDESLSMRPFLKGLSFSAAHVDVLMLERLPLAAQLLQEVWAALPSLPVLPQVWFAMKDIDEALDYMAKGVHVGKIAVLTGAQVPTRDTFFSDSTLKCLQPIGPCNDPVFKSLNQHPLYISGGGGIAVMPGMLNQQNASYLGEERLPKVVFAEYSCVAVLARSLGVKVVVELRPWQPIHSLGCQEIQRMLRVLNGEGTTHLIAAIPSSGQSQKVFDRAELEDWISKTVSHISGGSEVNLNDSFELYGVDSLAQITLARRISAHTGIAGFSVGDLMRNPSISSTLDHLQKLLSSSDDPVSIVDSTTSILAKSKSRVLCFHGFRSSGELLELALNSLFRHLSSGKRWQDFVELEFITAPHDSSGPTDPDIPEGMPSFEWWCGEDKTYEDGWTLLGDVGRTGKLERSRSHILSIASKSASPVVGLIGFSQGAAMACHMARRGDFAKLEWVACFSAVPPTNIDKDYKSSNTDSTKMSYDSFHCYDEEEEHAWLCRDVVDSFDSSSVINHTDGHAIPKQAAVADKFLKFISRK